MSIPLTPMTVAQLPVLDTAVSLGFPRLSYSIDVLDGVIDPPDEMVGVGFSLDYMRGFLSRLSQDPLRRRFANGTVELGGTPVVFVNTGQDIRVEGHTLKGDPALLGWCLGEGIRTGVSFRVPLDQGRCGSVNFYSPDAFDEAALEAVLPAVFLAGHRVHKLLSQRRAAPRDILLSRREMDCLLGMARGRSNPQIARELGLSTETVKEYACTLFRKLRARNRAEAVSRGHALNYLGRPPDRGDWAVASLS